MSTKTIVFIHGNFVSYHSWQPWIDRFEARGYTCVPIAYPGRDKPVEELRRVHPDPKLGALTIEETIEHHVRTIQALDEPPIIIGHSFGGLLTQLMVNRGLGAAAVAIDSVPPKGVLSFKWSFIKSIFPVANPLHPISRPWMMPFKHYQYAFDNGSSLAEQRRGYESTIVPESVRLSRGGLTNAAKVDFKKSHAPLLFIGGEIDHIMPASLNKANFKRYKASNSVTEFREFPGRSHYSVIAGDGWEEVADFALDWAERQLASSNSNSRREPMKAVGVR